MKMCSRCPGASGCLLNYNGKACENWRKKNAPDVIFTNADLLDEQVNSGKAKILVGLLYQVAYKTNPEHYIRKWLESPAGEDIQ